MIHSEALAAAFARFPTLTTDRCLLRAITPADTAALFELESDPQVTRYLGRAPMPSLEATARRIESFRTQFDTRQALQWGVVPRPDGPLIGTCVFWHLRPAHYRAEIGYMLSPAWWGQGVMSEVVAAVLDFGFATMGLHSVDAQIDPANAASRRLLEKLGFVQEAYFREDYFHPVEQRFTDTAIFSLLVSGWRTR